MSTEETFTALAQELFQTLGLPTEADPDSGVYTLGVDDHLDVHLTHDQHGNVVLFSAVGEITSYGYAEQKYQWLLARHRVGDLNACHVFLSDGDVIFWRSMPMAGSSAQQLINVLESFSTSALEAKTNLETKKPSLSDYEQMRQEDLDSLPPWAVRG